MGKLASEHSGVDIRLSREGGRAVEVTCVSVAEFGVGTGSGLTQAETTG